MKPKVHKNLMKIAAQTVLFQHKSSLQTADDYTILLDKLAEDIASLALEMDNVTKETFSSLKA